MTDESELQHVADTDLLAQARDGDGEAWRVVIERYAPMLTAYIGARLRKPAVVDRIVEQAFVAAYKKIDQRDASEAPGAWLRRIAGRYALRWYKDHPGVSLVDPFPVDRVPDELRHEVDRLSQLEVAFQRLRGEQRMALELYYRGGLRAADLAAALHCTVDEAAERVASSLEALRDDLTNIENPS